MNIRKNTDYSSLYDGIDRALAASSSPMELYLELGRLVSSRPEKGAAVMAAEYIAANYPDRTGFSPRNLRRMRDFYRMYEGYPEVLEQAMKVGWTQNIVILEADLDMEGRSWYLRAVWRFGWPKAELTEKISQNAYWEAICGEDISTVGSADTQEKPLTIQNAISRIVAQTVDFRKELWYNWIWQICFSDRWVRKVRRMGRKTKGVGRERKDYTGFLLELQGQPVFPSQQAPAVTPEPPKRSIHLTASGSWAMKLKREQERLGTAGRCSSERGY